MIMIFCQILRAGRYLARDPDSPSPSPARDPVSPMPRNAHSFFTRPWWAMGEVLPGAASPRINETATRARAGLLNMLSATTIFLLVAAPELDPVIYVGPFVIFDMFAAAAWGLTPLSPVGLVGTAMTMWLRPAWKPTQPKRFAWILGGSLGVVCLTMRLLHVDNAWTIDAANRGERLALSPLVARTALSSPRP